MNSLKTYIVNGNYDDWADDEYEVLAKNEEEAKQIVLDDMESRWGWEVPRKSVITIVKEPRGKIVKSFYE